MASEFTKNSKGISLIPKSSEPTGEDGDIYYSSALNKFRIYQNGAWQDMSSASNATSRNYLINGEFRFFQRQDPTVATSRQDAQYGADQWYVLTSGGATNINVSRVADSPTNQYTKYCLNLSQGDATARQFGGVQFLESHDCLPLRGKQVTFAFWARTNSTEITSIRAGVVEWTSTADAVTGDIVSSWAATPTLIANAAFINTPADLTISSTWAQFSVTVTLGTTFNNLGVFIWTPNTEAQNDDLVLAQCQLVTGSSAIDWSNISKNYDDDLSEAQRFYEKSYNIDVAPGTATTVGKGIVVIANGASTAISIKTWKVRKRANPTMVVYSSDGTADRLMHYATDVNNTITAYTDVSETGFYYITVGGGTLAANTPYMGQYTVSSVITV